MTVTARDDNEAMVTLKNHCTLKMHPFGAVPADWGQFCVEL